MTLMPRSIRSPGRRPPPRRNPYERFRERELTLTDYLAIDRTILANERTGLAYARAALAMIIIGGTAVKFFTEWYMWAVGGVFLIGSILVGVVGARRYLRTARHLAAALERQTGDPGHPLREAEPKAKQDARPEEGQEQRKDAKPAREPKPEPGSAEAPGSRT